MTHAMNTSLGSSSSHNQYLIRAPKGAAGSDLRQEDAEVARDTPSRNEHSEGLGYSEDDLDHDSVPLHHAGRRRPVVYPSTDSISSSHADAGRGNLGALYPTPQEQVYTIIPSRSTHQSRSHALRPQSAHPSAAAAAEAVSLDGFPKEGSFAGVASRQGFPPNSGGGSGVGAAQSGRGTVGGLGPRPATASNNATSTSASTSATAARPGSAFVKVSSADREYSTGARVVQGFAASRERNFEQDNFHEEGEEEEDYYVEEDDENDSLFNMYPRDTSSSSSSKSSMRALIRAPGPLVGYSDYIYDNNGDAVREDEEEDVYDGHDGRVGSASPDEAATPALTGPNTYSTSSSASASASASYSSASSSSFYPPTEYASVAPAAPLRPRTAHIVTDPGSTSGLETGVNEALRTKIAELRSLRDLLKKKLVSAAQDRARLRPSLGDLAKALNATRAGVLEAARRVQLRDKAESSGQDAAFAGGKMGSTAMGCEARVPGHQQQQQQQQSVFGASSVPAAADGPSSGGELDGSLARRRVRPHTGTGGSGYTGLNPMERVAAEASSLHGSGAGAGAGAAGAGAGGGTGGVAGRTGSVLSTSTQHGTPDLDLALDTEFNDLQQMATTLERYLSYGQLLDANLAKLEEELEAHLRTTTTTLQLDRKCLDLQWEGAERLRANAQAADNRSRKQAGGAAQHSGSNNSNTPSRVRVRVGGRTQSSAAADEAVELQRTFNASDNNNVTGEGEKGAEDRARSGPPLPAPPPPPPPAAWGISLKQVFSNERKLKRRLVLFVRHTSECLDRERAHAKELNRRSKIFMRRALTKSKQALDEIQQEITSNRSRLPLLLRRQEDLKAALSAHMGPLELCRHRYALRRERAAHAFEGPDEVADRLEEELAVLHAKAEAIEVDLRLTEEDAEGVVALDAELHVHAAAEAVKVRMYSQFIAHKNVTPVAASSSLMSSSSSSSSSFSALPSEDRLRGRRSTAGASSDSSELQLVDAEHQHYGYSTNAGSGSAAASSSIAAGSQSVAQLGRGATAFRPGEITELALRAAGVTGEVVSSSLLNTPFFKLRRPVSAVEMQAIMNGGSVHVSDIIGTGSFEAQVHVLLAQQRADSRRLAARHQRDRTRTTLAAQTTSQHQQQHQEQQQQQQQQQQQRGGHGTGSLAESAALAQPGMTMTGAGGGAGGGSGVIASSSSSSSSSIAGASSSATAVVPQSSAKSNPFNYKLISTTPFSTSRNPHLNQWSSSQLHTLTPNAKGRLDWADSVVATRMNDEWRSRQAHRKAASATSVRQLQEFQARLMKPPS